MLDEGLTDLELCERIENLARGAGDTKLVQRSVQEIVRLVDDPDALAAGLVRLGNADLELR